MPGLVRLIVLVVIIAVVLSLVKKLQQNRSMYKKRSAQKKKDANASKKTVRCEHCGVYIPADEAIHDDGKVYCSEEHKSLAKKS